MSRLRRRYASFVAAVATVVIAIGLAPAAPANAEPAPPAGLTSTDGLYPVLSWAHVDGVTQYQLELSRTGDATGVFGGTRTTANRQYVLTEPLSWTDNAPLYWRVAAKAPAVGAWSEWTAIPRADASWRNHWRSSVSAEAQGCRK